MPIALLALGALLVMTAINGEYANVGAAFEQDVMGNGQGGGFLSFIVGIVGIVGIAAFFRLIGMPNAGKVFIVLVILAYLLKNANVLTALESIGAPAAQASTNGQAAASGTALNPANQSALNAAGNIPTSGVPSK